MARKLEAVIAAAERVLRTWEPVWTPFLDGALLEEALEKLAGLAELDLASRGGYPGAERQRLLLQRHDVAINANEVAAGLMGLELVGNFLFDPAERQDFRAGLLGLGAAEGGAR